jgi:hypothetical protein
MQQLGDLVVTQVAAEPKSDQGTVPTRQTGNFLEQLGVAETPQSEGFNFVRTCFG